MSRLALIALLSGLALPASAQDMPSASALLDGPAFDQRFTGKTVFYDRHGQGFGVEQYNRDRTVIWQFDGGDCEYGHWWEESGAICFSYEAAPDRQICWWFFDQNDETHARVVGDPPSEDLTVGSMSDTPLTCRGPMVGA